MDGTPTFATVLIKKWNLNLNKKKMIGSINIPQTHLTAVNIP
jgi:hypothetical protein